MSVQYENPNMLKVDEIEVIMAGDNFPYTTLHRIIVGLQNIRGWGPEGIRDILLTPEVDEETGERTGPAAIEILATNDPRLIIPLEDELVPTHDPEEWSLRELS